MAERMADGRIADYNGTVEWQKGYIPNLPDMFTVHADTDDDDDDDTLIFYSIEYCNCNTIKLSRNGAECKCKLLNSCQANVSTKTRQKGCAGKCLETVR